MPGGGGVSLMVGPLNKTNECVLSSNTVNFIYFLQNILYLFKTLCLLARREQDCEIWVCGGAEGRGHPEGRQDHLVLRARRRYHEVLHPYSQEVLSGFLPELF